MRRPFVILVLLACFEFLAPTPAHAQFWRWIDELSGPGSFDGVSLPWRLVCIGGEPARATISTVGRVGYGAAALGGSGCLLQPGAVPRASVNLESTWAWARRNDLNYASDVDTSVHLAIIEPTFSVHLAPNLDNDWVKLDIGAGVFLLSGPAFNSFSRAFMEPIRAEFRPLAKVPYLKALILRGAIIVVPQGFDATDFGAIPGTFHTSGDVLKSAGIFVDWVRLRR
jgi:hypothetical protein